MDRDAFDGLARLLAASPTRRAALAALLAAALATVEHAAAERPHERLLRRAHRRQQRRRNHRHDNTGHDRKGGNGGKGQGTPQTRDCPDGTVACRLNAGPGVCGDCVSVFPTAGRCWHGDKGTCCPCSHADQAYWTQQCNLQDACKPDKCYADDNTLYFGRCFGNCSGEDLC